MPGRHDFTTSHPVSWCVLAERIFEIVYPGMVPHPSDFVPGSLNRRLGHTIGIAGSHLISGHQRFDDGMSWTYSRRYGSNTDASAVVTKVLATPLPAYQLADTDVQLQVNDVLNKPSTSTVDNIETWGATFAAFVSDSQLNSILHPRGYVWWYGRITPAVGVHGPTIVIQRKTQFASIPVIDGEIECPGHGLRFTASTGLVAPTKLVVP